MNLDLNWKKHARLGKIGERREVLAGEMRRARAELQRYETEDDALAGEAVRLLKEVGMGVTLKPPKKDAPLAAVPDPVPLEEPEDPEEEDSGDAPASSSTKSSRVVRTLSFKQKREAILKALKDEGKAFRVEGILKRIRHYEIMVPALKSLRKNFLKRNPGASKDDVERFFRSNLTNTLHELHLRGEVEGCIHNRRWYFWIKGANSDGLQNTPYSLTDTELFMLEALRSTPGVAHNRQTVGEIIKQLHPTFVNTSDALPLHHLVSMGLAETFKGGDSGKMIFYRAISVKNGPFAWMPPQVPVLSAGDPK